MRRSAKFTVLGVLGAVLLLSGCTTYVSVASDPEGAVITSADGSETYGRAPVTIEYDRDTLAQERAKRAEADRRRLQLYYQGGWMHGPFFGPGFWYFP